MRPGPARVAIVTSTKLLAHLVTFILDHGTYEQRIVPSIAEAMKVIREWEPVSTRDELLDLVRGRDFVPDSNVVDWHIATLRAKLGRSGAPLLTTVAGRGYHLNTPGLAPPGRRPRES